jgi:hypothetical protein
MEKQKGTLDGALQIAGHSLLWNVVCERHGANV